MIKKKKKHFNFSIQMIVFGILIITILPMNLLYIHAARQSVKALNVQVTVNIEYETSTTFTDGYVMATDPAAGETLTVSFGLEKLSQIRMQVEAISEAEDGVCTIVLSCEREPQEVTALRRQSADIIFSSYTGLRVPKQALYMVDGQAGVYVLEGARARWKPVEILYAYGDGYVVELDQSSTGNLWPGDDIILTSDDIEDGKVMEA